MGVLTTALLAPIRYWRQAIRCFWLWLIFAGAALLALSAPLSGWREVAANVASRIASHSILWAISTAAIGFAATVMLLVVAASAFVAWHRFLIHGEEAQWPPRVSVGRSLSYGMIAIATAFAVILPFVVIALAITLSFASLTGANGADGVADIPSAWLTSWTGNSTLANSIDVEFHDHLGLPHVAFDGRRLAGGVVEMETPANLLAYGSAAALLYAGGLLLVRVAAGQETPRRPPWFTIGVAVNFLAYAIAWLLIVIAVETIMGAMLWEGVLALLAPIAFAVSLLALLFAVSFVAAAASYLYAGDPWRYPGFYALD